MAARVDAITADIPAVVAMQFSITDKAAITQAQKFSPLLNHDEAVYNWIDIVTDSQEMRVRVEKR